MGQGDRSGRRVVGTEVAKGELLALIRSGERVRDALRKIEEVSFLVSGSAQA